MKLDKVKVENFLTYEKEEFNIPSRPLQVQGRNLTEEDQESNGSGKSGLFTAIEFCITASNSRDVRDAELVMYGQPEAKVELFASCNVRKEEIHISWVIRVKGSNKLTLKKRTEQGEWEEVSFSNVNDGKKYILSWFAISKDDLFNYYIINKTRFKSFFKASQREKVDLINRFSDASIVDGLEKIDNSDLQEEYDSLQQQVSKLEGKIELTEENLIKEKSRNFEEELNEEKEDILEEIDFLEAKKDEIVLKIKDRELDIKEEEEQFPIIENSRLELNNSREEIQTQILSQKNVIKSIEGDLEKASTLVESFKKTDWSKLASEDKNSLISFKNKIEKFEETKSKQEDQKTKILTFLRNIEVKLESSITCPKCSHEFVLGGDIEDLKQKKLQGEELKSKIEAAQISVIESIESIETQISSIQEKLSSINAKEEEENKDFSKLREAVNNIQQLLNTKSSDLQILERKLQNLDKKSVDLDNEENETKLEIKEIQTEIKGFEGEISSLNQSIENYKSQLESLKLGNNKDNIKELKKELKTLQKTLTSTSKALESKGDEIYHRNQWANNFKQFRMHLANQSLEAIEFHCNRYLVGMGSDLKVKFEGYRMLADGRIKDEISSKIIRNVERTFSSFSGGEQGRLLFAAILANRHMINSTHPYGGLDFLSVDEVFEGVDSLGLRSLIMAAKQLEVAVMIITHVTDEEVSDDTLLIEKVNGISKIK